MSNIYDANTTTGSITTNDSDSNPILAQPSKDLNYYRAELTGLWRKTTGRVFSQAKDDLTPDEYKALIDLPLNFHPAAIRASAVDSPLGAV